VDSTSKCNHKRLEEGSIEGEGSGVSYQQLGDEERVVIAGSLSQGLGVVAIARRLGRDRSTVYRELKRNRSTHDGRYRALHAGQYTRGRRRRSRRNRRFGEEEFEKVKLLLARLWSPEQISGRLRENGELSMSHETIYKYVWADKASGGELYRLLRGASKLRRKRYGAYDSRGRVSGKRRIEERPQCVEKRERFGDWEIDTVLGHGKNCVVTLVERKSGYLLVGKLKERTANRTNARILHLLEPHRQRLHTITSDNGCEFHRYAEIEKRLPVLFYFAAPHHAWERGTNENTNGLLRQYLPKGKSMENVTQHQCNAIAKKLNQRPRKRHKFKTPEEVLFNLADVALQS